VGRARLSSFDPVGASFSGKFMKKSQIPLVKRSGAVRDGVSTSLRRDLDAAS
jgi:hypothetical protein